VQSAVEEANVRRGLNEVFLNIARRSQTLLHRQLALLDRMERRETEPLELEDLYRVDHLATRMRRHAEDLVILAGAAPGRGWRNPVPVIDVIRGAISEVEDYKRIDVRSIETSAILGRAVGDVIHLLAELFENATSFSPPQTRVHVSGQVLPNGYAIEIEDRGLGMSHEAIDEANRRLVEPPEFDPTDSARLGLFVVAQLASRHGIRVALRQSAYAGITAVVLVPGDLVVGTPEQAALPGGASLDRPLVGSGTADRSSLAALQWQGAEKLEEILVTGRPVTLAGLATVPELEAPPEPKGGPAPSSVAGGLNADGLVQRRRVRKQDVEVDLPGKTEDGLPKRVRQASLAPQLRRPAGSLPDEPTVPLRSPEQMRSIMSALQQGTTRGRLDASRLEIPRQRTSEDHPRPAETGNGAAPGGTSFADAATVSFPAIVSLALADSAVEEGAATPEQNDVTRPEKDTE